MGQYIKTYFLTLPEKLQKVFPIGSGTSRHAEKHTENLGEYMYIWQDGVQVGCQELKMAI